MRIAGHSTGAMVSRRQALSTVVDSVRKEIAERLGLID
jgi:hypothetical protein